MNTPDEIKRQRDRLLIRAEKAATFLEQIARHLDENDMPGQAGNCTIQAKALRAAMKGTA